MDEVIRTGGFGPLALEPADLLTGSLGWKDSWCPVAPFPLWRRPLSFRGGCEQSAQWPLRFCCLCFLELFPTPPGYSNSCCEAESAPWGQCPGPPGRWGRSHSYFAPWDLRVCIAAALQHRVICICVVFFCPRSHSELCSELLPLARSTARAGSLLQLTWCLPQIQQFKLKLALAFKVSSNPFNSSALCEKQMGNIKTYISSCNSQSEWGSCKKFTVRRRTVCKLSLCSKTVYYQRIILGDSCCWGILCLFFFLLLLHFSHPA